MTIHELINLSIKKLSTSTSPSLDGEVLLSHVLDKPKEYLVSNPEKKVDPKKEKLFLTLLNRRLLGWPVAYLTNKKEFFKLKFYVDKKVLIPRPETEGLIELALKKIKSPNKLKMLDVGTGSGNIIITVAKLFGSKNQYFASDVSSSAITVAKKNAKLHKVKVNFKQGSLLEPWSKQKFDVIFANLPYLAKLVDPSTKHEPKGALVAAKKGVKLYEELFLQLITTHHLPNYIFIEIGRDQGPIIKKLVEKLLPSYKTNIVKDLADRDRYAVLTLK